MKYFNKQDLNYSNGFTLAEVLITLVIIGVIAAMTIPTLMKNTQKQELVSGLKKANSTLQQALINIARNNDSSPGDYSFLNSVDFIDELAKVTNVIKKCNTPTACFGVDLNSSGVYKTLNKLNPSISNGKAVILSDGQILTYVRMTDSGSGLTQEDSANLIGRIAIDINGQKGPNVIGRDTFYLYIVNGKGIVPAGASSSTDCSTSGTGYNGTGYSCAGKVLRENAMNY